jgi:hypothetical protein
MPLTRQAEANLRQQCAVASIKLDTMWSDTDFKDDLRGVSDRWIEMQHVGLNRIIRVGADWIFILKSSGIIPGCRLKLNYWRVTPS